MEKKETSNWILNKIDRYSIVSKELYRRNHFFRAFSIPLSGLQDEFAWKKIPNSFSFCFEEHREFVIKWLSISDLSLNDEIIVDFGYNELIVAIETSIFIQNWYDFASWGGFEGIIAYSRDCKFLLEFTDDYQYLLYSNFLIKPDSLSV